MKPSLPGETWFVGCGNMAGAMVEGWRKAGLDLSQAIAIRPSGKPVEGVTTVNRLPEGSPALVMLGFKPQKLDEIAPELASRIGPDTIVVSILAGIEAASLRARFPNAGAIIRAMPNLPVSEGRGVVALFGEVDSFPSAPTLFAPLGFVHVARDEQEFAAIGSVAGAGPAYVARFIAALAKAGEARSLSDELASRIALETVHGTALMAQARGETMEDIARRVASPKGTTEAGLAVLDADGALDRLVAETIEAAARRGAQLAADARVRPR